MCSAPLIGMKYLAGLSCAFVVAACGTSDSGAMEPEMANAGAADHPAPGQAADPVQASDQAGQGASRRATLPQPSIDTGGSTTATVAPSPDGPRVRIDGGTAPAAYALVTYMIATGAMSATAEFTVNPAPGASFEYMMVGTGSGYSSRHLRLQRVPGSNTLQAVSTSGAVACGTLASGQPTTVTLAFDGTAKTFDVLIAGARSACTELSTKVAGPVNGFLLTDATLEGYGGHVEFSDLTLLY
jgi:hypothetical protein